MPTILICSDFSDSSDNAISYVFKMSAENKGALPLQFVLYHLFEIPTSYSGDGISLTTLNREIDLAEDKLNDECAHLRNHYPNLKIVPKLSTGNDLRHGLEKEITETDPYLVIIGAGGKYSELLSWDKEIIGIVRELPVPVLIIPKTVSFAPVNRVGFACNLKNANHLMPFPLIIRFVNFVNAELYVLFVKNEVEKKDLGEAESFVIEKLNTLNPVYHSVNDPSIVRAVSDFVKAHDINILLVTPRKHGIWDNVFYKDHARELIRLNSIPILALRQ